MCMAGARAKKSAVDVLKKKTGTIKAQGGIRYVIGKEQKRSELFMTRFVIILKTSQNESTKIILNLIFMNTLPRNKRPGETSQQ